MPSFLLIVQNFHRKKIILESYRVLFHVNFPQNKTKKSLNIFEMTLHILTNTHRDVFTKIDISFFDLYKIIKQTFQDMVYILKNVYVICVNLSKYLPIYLNINSKKLFLR